MSEASLSDVARRTHNYLRLALAGMVGVVLVAVTVESIRRQELLPTISHYYYTPARNMLVAALIAASLVMIALSGRNLESVLLDVAAPFAPLVALVPTHIASGDVAGVAVDCAASCVPAHAVPDVANGVITYLIGLVAVLAVGGVIWLREPVPPGGAPLPRRRGLTIALAVGLAVGIAVIATALIDVDGEPALLRFVHFPAAGLFVLAFSAVPLAHVLARSGARPARWERAVYLAVIAALAVALVLGLLGLTTPGIGWPAIFWAEALALVAFAVFWVVQTVRRWDEPDPPSLR